MAVTGLILIGFLLMHMFGNLKIFIGAEAYDYYANYLKQDLLYPVLPHGWFIWLFRVFLVACAVIHIYCAYRLWRASVRGRGAKYVKVHRRERTYSAATMRVGGVLLLLLLVFHLLMFTTNSIQIGWGGVVEPYTMFMGAFSHWWVVVIYLAFMVVVCLHIRHGFWSAFTTLGANIGPNSRIALNALAYFVAALLFVGFLLPPVATLFGWVS